jgi:hypothetical protein
MQRITMLGMALLAALALIATDTVSVSASGHEFIASKSGKTKSKSTNAQVFKTSAGALECAEVTGAGEIEKGSLMAHKETYTYSGCYAFGEVATVTPADFEFNANGPVKLENTVEVTVNNGECEILLEPQTVEKASYENKPGGKLEAIANAVKVTSKGTGHLCGSGINKEGSYKGIVLGELEGGTIEWK